MNAVAYRPEEQRIKSQQLLHAKWRKCRTWSARLSIIWMRCVMSRSRKVADSRCALHGRPATSWRWITTTLKLQSLILTIIRPYVLLKQSETFLCLKLLENCLLCLSLVSATTDWTETDKQSSISRDGDDENHDSYRTYWKRHDSGLDQTAVTRTAIVLPIRSGSRTLGIYTFY